MVRTLAVRDEAAPEDLQFLEEQINEFNFTTTGIRDARGLVILLRDADRTIYAGLSGHTWGGVAEVRFLWVDEPKRHTGIGSRLLRAAEHEARTRGCRKIVLSTHSFQAPGFYGKHGYIVVGGFSEYPRGHRSIFLRRSCRDDRDTNRSSTSSPRSRVVHHQRASITLGGLGGRR